MPAEGFGTRASSMKSGGGGKSSRFAGDCHGSSSETMLDSAFSAWPITVTFRTLSTRVIFDTAALSIVSVLGSIPARTEAPTMARLAKETLREFP